MVDKKVKQIVKSTSGKEVAPKNGFKEAVKDIGSSLMTGVVIPAAKDMLYDFIINGASMSIYHDKSGVKRAGLRGRSNGSTGHYTSYNSISDGDRGNAPGGQYVRSSRGVNIFRPSGLSRQDCMDILDELDRLIEEYGYVTVSDYNQTIGHTSRNPKQDNRWGWEDLESAYPSHDVNGWYISFPRMESIE